MAAKDPKTLALTAFILAIEATGGVVKTSEGLTAPVGDEEWIDLGDCYLQACAALNRKPMYAECIDCGGTNISEGTCLDCLPKDEDGIGLAP